MLYYQLLKGTDAPAEYSTEVLTPMYENIYVKKFVLFANEKLKYYFKEVIDGNTYRSDKKTCTANIKEGDIGRYGRLNDVMLSEGEEYEKKLKEYMVEDTLASKIFEQYE